MHALAVAKPAPRQSTSTALSKLFVDERERDTPGIALPRPEVHVVVRFGASVPGGLDVHAMGPRPSVKRKILRRGQRTVGARLQLGMVEAVLGVPASALAGRIVALDELWDGPLTRRLCARLADAATTAEAASVLERAFDERLARQRQLSSPPLVLCAAERLTRSSVSDVARELGVSERHLRRVFRDATGLGPKSFAKLARFRSALRAAARQEQPSWANVAALVGYYDQAHLISECRAIAGVTPQELLTELRVAQTIL